MLRRIVSQIATKHGLTEAEIYVRDRSVNLVAARHEAWAACRHAGFTYAAIAALAGWNHTSVVHGVDKHLNKPGAWAAE